MLHESLLWLKGLLPGVIHDAMSSATIEKVRHMIKVVEFLVTHEEARKAIEDLMEKPCEQES